MSNVKHANKLRSPALFFPFRILLVLPSLLYGIALKLDRFWRKKTAYKFPCPVVSVGNISVGGTGKTPLVAALIEAFLKMGVRPAVLSHGYRGWMKPSRQGIVGLDQREGEPFVGDEPTLLARVFPEVPIGVGPDRVRRGREILLTFKPDVFILDDGFQHWPIQRDLDILCVDALDPWGGGHLIPWGRLREPPSSVRRAQVAVITRTEFVPAGNVSKIRETLRALAPTIMLFNSMSRSSLQLWGNTQWDRLSVLKDRTCVALSGIGRPDAFESSLEKAGARVIPLRFRDHYEFIERDIERMIDFSKNKATDIVTTEKDLMRLKRCKGFSAMTSSFRVWIARVSVIFSDSDQVAWENLLRKKVILIDEKN